MGGLVLLLAMLGLLAATGSTSEPAREGGDGARTFGHSVRERPLQVRRDGPSRRVTHVLVVGVIHGDETAGRPIIRRLRHRREPAQLKLWTVRSLNPDGAAARTRQNARGVDLNRNFPAGWRRQGSPWSTYYSGRRPRSEPETRAAMRLIERVRPDLTIWYHQALNSVAATRGAAERVYRRYAREAEMRVERLPRYPGTAPRWQNERFDGSSAFVVELPAGRLSRSAIRRHAEAVLAAGRAA